MSSEASSSWTPPPVTFVDMSVIGTTFSNSSAQQIVLGEVIGSATSRLGNVPEHSAFADAHDVPAPTSQERREEVAQLARTVSRRSSIHPPSPSVLHRQLSRRSSMHPAASSTQAEAPLRLFEYDAGSDLDPFSPSFDARKYTKALAQVGNEAMPPRTAGLAYTDLSVHGFGSDADYQKTVSNLPLSWIGSAKNYVRGSKRRVQILNSMDGVIEAGEMLVVLGPPGSGCTTLLKTIAGEMNGIYLDEASRMNYRGISPEEMRSQFRGEAIYTAEVDVHFPKLTVGQTLAFAAEARAPRTPPQGLTQVEYATHVRDVAMAIFGISHTVNTIVGNEYIRGVSGGERKRVSIAEAALSGAPLQCWDNSTRGLDSANAIEFCKNLRIGSEFMGTTSVVAIYQAPQSAYDLFDKVCVLYEGEQIFFGKTTAAKDFFLDMGFDCPDQQTVPDFLTSLTSPAERKARQGFEHSVPQTPAEFARRWKQSTEYQALQEEIRSFHGQHQIGGEKREQFLASRRAQQSKHIRAKSPYTLSYYSQIKLCLKRGFWRLRADPSLTITQVFGNVIMSLIISSVFYNLQPTTASFFQRGSILFFAVLVNAFGAALEILTLYAQRPIVEKHMQYAFYHPSAEAWASMLTDLPAKIINALAANLTLYFMANLRRTPGAFFFYLLINFFATLTMSMIFRSIASLSRQFVQAMTPAAVIMIGLIVYTGFAIPVTYMRGWARWINYIDPIAYAFESLIINEFADRDFSCSQFIPFGPTYDDASGTQRVCYAVGSQPGQSFVDGTAYITTNFQYYPSHKWRNFGILLAFMFAFLGVYIAATELVTAKRSKGEILIFPRGRIPKDLANDEEAQSDRTTLPHRSSEEGFKTEAIIQRQTAIFSWKDVTYDIKIKKEARRILDHVDGWVKPGTLTALMGVSGAGKTTLLDVLATRVTMGVVTGEVLVDGRPRDVSFQRKTGYVQQQDLHLETGTVREALQFSAELRQPRNVTRAEKYAYVEEVLKLLEMDSYADAIVGVPGSGLNVEQRKRLTIGVELVAKPELLLFLDEPTSGLDSQTSWNILQLLRKLTDHGQAILCTIHQPSAILFENFDRLLFLAKGGKTVYFGEVGQGSHILIDYFERNGAIPYPHGSNPAEWMLDAIGASPGSHTDIDWHATWNESPERVKVREDLQSIKKERGQVQATVENDKFKVVLKRVFQQYWRTPSYIWSKFLLSIATGLFIGFSFFKSGTSIQGLQNQLFSIFLMFTIFSQLVQQIMPNFVTQRSLYESRERPSKTYSWKIFILSNIVVEIPWNMLVATIFFLCYYYPVGYAGNAVWTNTVHLRGAQMFLFMQVFFLFTSTFATAIIAGMDLAETAGNIANLMFSLCLIFCGFWVFMYRVSPFTYFVKGILAVGVADAPVVCSETEILRFDPPSGQTCSTYLQAYQSYAPGDLLNGEATSQCEFCPVTSTNQVLDTFSIFYTQVWENFGILWAFIVFNIFAAFGLYWLARVPKTKGESEKDKQNGSVKAAEPELPNGTGLPRAMPKIVQSSLQKEKVVDGGS